MQRVENMFQTLFTYVYKQIIAYNTVILDFTLANLVQKTSQFFLQSLKDQTF